MKTARTIVGFSALAMLMIWIAAAFGIRSHYFTNSIGMGMNRKWMFVAIAPNGSGGVPKTGYQDEEPTVSILWNDQPWWIADLEIGNWRMLPIPYWLANLVLWSLFLVPIIPFRKLRRIPAGHCQSCGYNLTGNQSGKCPECNAEVPE